MTDEELRALLDLAMCCDPWPVDEDNQNKINDLLNRESKERGYQNWFVAFHELRP